MFDRKSRYYQLAPYEVTDHRGRRVVVMPTAPRPSQTELGVHLRTQGQRLDHLAQKYLNDATAFWRICELNGAMWPDQFAETREVHIPAPSWSA